MEKEQEKKKKEKRYRYLLNLKTFDEDDLHRWRFKMAQNLISYVLVYDVTK